MTDENGSDVHEEVARHAGRFKVITEPEGPPETTLGRFRLTPGSGM